MKEAEVSASSTSAKVAEMARCWRTSAAVNAWLNTAAQARPPRSASSISPTYAQQVCCSFRYADRLWA